MAKAVKLSEVKDAPEVESPKEATPEVIHYQEWECKIENENGKPHARKIGISRPCVKIEDEHAEILNEGALHGSNSYVKMYFKPE